MQTPLAIAVLALLRERPMHPYEMHQLLRERHVDAFVKLKAGSLYHTVDRLERESLVESVATERSGNRPERTTYRLTSAGDAVVREWVSDRLATPLREYPVYSYALTEAHNLGADEATTALEQRCAALTAGLEELEAAMSAPAAEHVFRIGVEHRAAMLTAELDWTRGLIERIERKDFSWDPWT